MSLNSEQVAYTVLLVEDNPMDVDLTKRALGRAGIEIRINIARDGEEAIGYIDRWDQGETLPRFILLDLKLPKINGIEVLKRLKAHPKYQRIPIIILSSSTEDTDLKNAYTLGVNSYIRKAINYDEFIKTAADIERYWCKLNVLPQISDR
jgi:CheY-like chemotaxis protein